MTGGSESLITALNSALARRTGHWLKGADLLSVPLAMRERYQSTCARIPKPSTS